MADVETPEEETKPSPEGGQKSTDVVRSVIERIGEALDTTGKVARLSLDIGALNSRRNALFQEMGARVYELYGKGLVKNAALGAMCADAADVDAQVAQKRAQIAELRGQKETAPAPPENEEMGIEEEPGAPPTSSDDLTSAEEQQLRPGDKKL